jgi:hypothetical protein
LGERSGAEGINTWAGEGIIGYFLQNIDFPEVMYMKLGLMLLLCLVYVVPLAAQSTTDNKAREMEHHRFDSLESALNAAPTDKKSQMIDDIMRQVRNSQFDIEKLYLQFGRAMIRVGKETGNDTLVVRGLNILAISPREIGGRDSAFAFRLKALQIAREKGFLTLKRRILGHLVQISIEEYNDYLQAYQYSLEYQNITKNQYITKIPIVYYSNLMIEGFMDLGIQSLPHILHYSVPKLLSSHIYDDSVEVSMVFFVAAKYYVSKRLYDSANYCIHQFFRLEEALKEQMCFPEAFILQAKISKGLGASKQEVMLFIQKAIVDQRNSYDRNYAMANTYLESISLYRAYGMLDSSLFYARQMTATLQKAQYPLPALQADLYRELALIYASRKDSARAFIFQERYSTIRDSINLANTQRAMKELSTRQNVCK